MSKQERWTDADSKRLLALHGQGVSLHSSSSQMGKPKSTVSYHAKRLKLVWNREATARATEAVVVDNKARRAKLNTELLEDAARLRKQMWEPAFVWNIGGANNTYTEQWLEKPVFNDQKTIMQAVSTAVNASAKLEDADSDTRDMPAVDMWLVAMGAGIKEVEQ